LNRIYYEDELKQQIMDKNRDEITKMRRGIKEESPIIKKKK